MTTARIPLLLALCTPLLFQGTLLGEQQTKTREVTSATPICDLLRHLDTFNGKRIVVRGVYRFSMELGGLYSEGCQKPLMLDGRERAQALSTEFVGRSPEEHMEHEDFAKVVNEIAKSCRREAIHVTFVGVLVTRNPELHRLGSRKGERMFGHLGTYPAELKVEEIRDITIEDGARNPSNMECRR